LSRSVKKHGNQSILVCDWQIFFLSSPLKLLGQMNWNLVGSIYGRSSNSSPRSWYWHKLQCLFCRSILCHLPVSIGNLWFPVLNLQYVILSLSGKMWRHVVCCCCTVFVNHFTYFILSCVLLLFMLSYWTIFLYHCTCYGV
jgi:hypothetical protein